MASEPIATSSNCNIAEALSNVRRLTREAVERRPQHFTHEVNIIAVSKTKPLELIIEAYGNGQRHFGENYVNELLEKSNSEQILDLCPDIKWHFIGHVQSNKIKKLVMGCPNLYVIETVDSVPMATLTNSYWMQMQQSYPLNIMIQVNISKENSKSGILLDNVEELAKHVFEACPHLKLIGFMTIGAPNHDLNLGNNPDYQALVQCRDDIGQKFHVDGLILSMGMSADFEHAIELGSSYVRIGEKIFGSRVKK